MLVIKTFSVFVFARNILRMVHMVTVLSFIGRPIRKLSVSSASPIAVFGLENYCMTCKVQELRSLNLLNINHV